MDGTAARPAQPAAALVRRTETPATGLIVEQIVTFESGETPRASFTLMQVDGTKLSVSEREARFSGAASVPPVNCGSSSTNSTGRSRRSCSACSTGSS